MSRERVIIVNDFRPPVASIGGRSPVRNSLKGRRMLELDQSGSPVNNGQNKRYIEGGRLLNDPNWDDRHHISPSLFNQYNHTYYKQYFDKSSKANPELALRPQRMLDPYEMNEVKGTRMPDWSRVDKERDLYGELAWVKNFNVKLSKNNERMHRTYKEFFDQPRNYHILYNNTTQDFFRQTAPAQSVAAKGTKTFRNSSHNPFMRSYQLPPTQDSENNQNSQASFSPTQTKNSFAQTAPYSTPFYLHEDKTNKYRIDQNLKQTVDNKGMIPFLRTNDQEYFKIVQRRGKNSRSNSLNTSGYKQINKTHIQTENPEGATNSGEGEFSPAKTQRPYGGKLPKERAFNFIKKRESGWNQYILPISALNEQLHPSQKITFDKI